MSFVERRSKPVSASRRPFNRTTKWRMTNIFQCCLLPTFFCHSLLTLTFSDLTYSANEIMPARGSRRIPAMPPLSAYNTQPPRSKENETAKDSLSENTTFSSRGRLVKPFGKVAQLKQTMENFRQAIHTNSSSDTDSSTNILGEPVRNAHKTLPDTCKEKKNEATGKNAAKSHGKAAISYGGSSQAFAKSREGMGAAFNEDAAKSKDVSVQFKVPVVPPLMAQQTTTPLSVVASKFFVLNKPPTRSADVDAPEQQCSTTVQAQLAAYRQSPLTTPPQRNQISSPPVASEVDAEVTAAGNEHSYPTPEFVQREQQQHASASPCAALQLQSEETDENLQLAENVAAFLQAAKQHANNSDASLLPASVAAADNEEEEEAEDDEEDGGSNCATTQSPLSSGSSPSGKKQKVKCSILSPSYLFTSHGFFVFFTQIDCCVKDLPFSPATFVILIDSRFEIVVSPVEQLFGYSFFADDGGKMTAQTRSDFMDTEISNDVTFYQLVNTDDEEETRKVALIATVTTSKSEETLLEAARHMFDGRFQKLYR